MLLAIYILHRRVQRRQLRQTPPGTVPKRLRGVKSRGGGEEVPSLEKKVEGRTYVVKAEGPGPRGGCWGTAVGYAYAGADVSGGRRGEAFGAGGGTD